MLMQVRTEDILMKYDVISADCHIDLIWLPPDLFTASASAALKERMPYVTDGPRGKEWVTKSGASFGLMNGMGSAGRLYEPGKIHRSDRMASEGIYEDGKRGIRRMTDPELRINDRTATASRPRSSTASWAPPAASTMTKPPARC